MPDALPYEPEARAISVQHKWSWRIIREVLVFLRGDIYATRSALSSAAALNLTPMAAARVNAAMTREETDA